MSLRRLLVYLGIFATGVLALFGAGVFIVGVLAEFFAQRQVRAINPELSPSMQLALAGLCLAGMMFILWFGLVGLLIARQTRLMGSGYAEAYRLIEAFKFRDAIPLLERTIREGKESPDVLMLLTSAYAYTGQLARAQSTADRAVQLFPDDPGSYVTLANGYRLQAAYEEAGAALRAAIDRAPEQPMLWAELGFVQQFAGDHAGALASFQQAAEHALPAMYELRVYYHLAQDAEANGDTALAQKYLNRMVHARDGLEVWQSGLNALRGTAYGSALHYEIEAIQQALTAAVPVQPPPDPA